MANWRKSPNYLQRSVGTRGAPKPTILIVCEGACTEPLYFEAFRVSSADVSIEGTGRNTDSLVQYAIDKKNAARNDPYDQVWCVFDRDSFPAVNFNRAIQLANANGIEVAYTNEAFELWYLLHFHYFHTGMSRQLYRDKLSENLNRPYEKNDRELYKTLVQRQSVAIRNAEKLLETYSPSDPCNDNPSTKVHLLVQELNKYKI